MTRSPSPLPHDGRRGGSPGTRCSGRGCRTDPRRSPGRSATACASSSAVVETTKPGVQKPHWRPCSAWNAACTGDSSPSTARPSTVVISAPSACTANTRHDRTASPSSRTVQAPHTPCSHPRCVPVRPQSSRRASARSLRGSTVRSRRSPLAVKETEVSGMASIMIARATARLTTAAAMRRRSAPGRVQVVRWFQPNRRKVADLRCIDSSASAPTSARSATSARMGVAATPNRAMVARSPGRRRPAHRRRIRRWRNRRVGGRPPRRRSPTRPPQTGKRTATSSSSSPAMSPTCRRRSRRPAPPHCRRPAMSISASSASATAGILGGRIGVGDRPAERAAVADLEVADQRRGRGQERNVAGLQLTLANHRPTTRCPFIRSSRAAMHAIRGRRGWRSGRAGG